MQHMLYYWTLIPPGVPWTTVCHRSFGEIVDGHDGLNFQGERMPFHSKSMGKAFAILSLYVLFIPPSFSKVDHSKNTFIFSPTTRVGSFWNLYTHNPFSSFATSLNLSSFHLSGEKHRMPFRQDVVTLRCCALCNRACLFRLCLLSCFSLCRVSP